MGFGKSAFHLSCARLLRCAGGDETSASLHGKQCTECPTLDWVKLNGALCESVVSEGLKRSVRYSMFQLDVDVPELKYQKKSSTIS